MLLLLGLGALAFVFNFLPASLQAPRVLQIDPANDATDILLTSPITITFSAPMQRVETQNALGLTPRVSGNFTWRDDQTLVFTPRTQLPISTTLTLTLARDARSWIGRALENETRSRFTTLAPPSVVDSSPALDARFVYVPNQVTIAFSRAMDGNLLADSVMIEPLPEQFGINVNQNLVTLRGFFQARTRYRITIPEFVTDKEFGIPLARDYVWAFTAASQYPNFSILNRGRVLKFSANTPIEIPTQFTNVSRLDVELYSISQSVFEEQANAPFESWYEFEPTTAPTKTRRVETNAQLDEYTQQSVSLDALSRGTYFLKITTPEGVSDAQLIVVE